MNQNGSHARVLRSATPLCFVLYVVLGISVDEVWLHTLRTPVPNHACGIPIWLRPCTLAILLQYVSCPACYLIDLERVYLICDIEELRTPLQRRERSGPACHVAHLMCAFQAASHGLEPGASRFSNRRDQG